MAGNTTINIFGYNEQRRHIAKQLQVDPYTTNKILSEKLDEKEKGEGLYYNEYSE